MLNNFAAAVEMLVCTAAEGCSHILKQSGCHFYSVVIENSELTVAVVHPLGKHPI